MRSLTGANEYCSQASLFDSQFSWYRFTMIYDETAMTFRFIATKESDPSYSVDSTVSLTSKVTFGGYDYGVFTIGAHYDPTGSGTHGQFASASINGVTTCPTMSDFRIYAGTIGKTELSRLAKYDEENATKPTEGYNALAHYEFKDETNLGKDSLGRFDLETTDGVKLDEEKGGVTLQNGVLYAPVDDAGKDFSDYVKSSYSVSMRAYLRKVSGGANYLLTTGRYGSHFQVDWASCGFSINLDGNTLGSFGTSTTGIGGAALFDKEFAWYRIHMIYDESALTFRVIVLREDNPVYSYDQTITLSNKVTFGGHSEYTLTVGGQSKAGQSVEQHASKEQGSLTLYPNISDIRIYTGVIDDAEMEAIAKYDDERFFDVSYISEGVLLKKVTVENIRQPKPYEPQRTGYQFGGWYDNAELSGQPIRQIDTPWNQDVTLYAKWIANEVEPEDPTDPDDSSGDNNTGDSDSSDTSEDTNSSENNDSSSNTTSNGDTESSSGCNGSISGASLAILPLCFAGIAIACKKKRKQ